MNVPDLRDVDFDAYRRQAEDLRRQAMQGSIDRVLALLTSLLGRSRPARSMPVAHVDSSSVHCAA